jgi:hypothetical protein
MNGPRFPRRATQPGANAATFLALGGLVVLGMGLLGLVSLVLPQALGILLVVGLFVFPVAFHYLVWGWWLSQVREQELSDDARAAGNAPERPWPPAAGD